MDKPSSGSILFDNYEINNNSLISLDLNSKIGVVYSRVDDYFSFNSVREEIEFVLKNHAYKLYDIENRVSDCLKIVGLSDEYLDCNPFKLSQSEKKKVSLAIALSFNPKVLILDDISVSLDNKSKKDLVKLLKMMKFRYKKTIILISDDSDFVHMVADDIYILNKGKVVSFGDKYTVFSNYDVLLKYDILVPKIMYFSYLVKDKKKVKLAFRDDINDLVKDIYRNVK